MPFSSRVRAATRSTATGRIPLSSDYVIEARLGSDEAEEEEEGEQGAKEQGAKGSEGDRGGGDGLGGLKVEELSVGEKTPLL